MPSIANHDSSGTHHPLVVSQFPSWYSQHSGHALKSIIIPLESGFLEYLQEDGLFLPDDTAAVPQLVELDATLLTEGDYRRDNWDRVGAGVDDAAAAVLAAGPQPSPSGPLHSGALSGSPRASDLQEPAGLDNMYDIDDNGADDGDSASSGAIGGGTDWTVRFPQLRAAVDSAIASLGGRVVPKLNWSCPSDALWVSASGSLACRNADEVLLLLKCSDRVAHDVALLAAAAEAARTSNAAVTAATDASAGASGSGVSEPKSEEVETAALKETVSGCSGEVAAAVRWDVAPSEGPSAPGPSDQCSAGQPHQEASGPTRDAVPSPQQPRQMSDRQHQNQLPTDLGDSTGFGGAGSVSVGGSTAVKVKEGEEDGPVSFNRHLGASLSFLALKPVLVLKKWYDIRREREFRCFVRDGELVAVSQRDVSQTFPALTTEVVADVRQRLWRFWQDKMQGSLPLTEFAFDVYVPTDVSTTARLVDINPLTDTTSPLLYDWAELGFGSDAVQPAEVLLQQLLQTDVYERRREERRGGHIEGAVTNRMQLADTAEASERGPQVDDSWMAAAAESVALPLPRRAEELQVRIMEDPNGSTRASDEPRSGDGGIGLAGLVGPMLLGSRAAQAMPYDMLGIADTVDKMIEVMQRHRHHYRHHYPRVTGSSPGESVSPGKHGVGEQGGAQSSAADVGSLSGMLVWPSHPLPCTRVPLGGSGVEVLPGGGNVDGEGDGASLGIELQEPAVHDNAAEFSIADFLIPDFGPDRTE
ncbi:hypothetical protein VaNZ11_009297 [Volvox africanus]|uniref:Cell division cycle protein 123 n=1 Tax=Volvox africanus TaxID=51714 RepID=A0ABQ5S7Z4_9CHLO|nr:hypothetical protein VaNZ11_009297 [Volvox africanus]